MNRRLSKMGWIILAALLCLSLIALPACTAEPTEQEEEEEPITLTAVSFQNKEMNSSEFFQRWVNRVNEAADGELVINYVGGPEVVAPPDLPNAVITGTIDIMSEPTTLYTSLMPTAPAFSFTEYTPAEQRASGWYDFFVDRHEEIGLRYIGRPKTTQPSIVAGTACVATPQEFAGKIFGLSSSTAVSFAEALNATVNMVTYDEIYTAFDQGNIDCMVDAIDTIVDSGLLEVINCIYDHELYAAARLAVSMNLDTWNSLPEHLQQLLIDEMAEHEMVVRDDEVAYREAAMATAEATPGIQIVQFSEDDAEWFVNLAYEVSWSQIEASIPAQQYDLLREVSGW